MVHIYPLKTKLNQLAYNNRTKITKWWILRWTFALNTWHSFHMHDNICSFKVTEVCILKTIGHSLRKWLAMWTRWSVEEGLRVCEHSGSLQDLPLEVPRGKGLLFKNRNQKREGSQTKASFAQKLPRNATICLCSNLSLKPDCPRDVLAYRQ